MFRRRPRSLRRSGFIVASAWAVAALGGIIGAAMLSHSAQPTTNSYVVMGYNELGMHCMQSDFSQMMILPPFNTLHAQVIRRGGSPEIMTSDVTVRFTVPGNTHSSDKCNFWKYVNPLMGLSPAPDIGITGTPMAGNMVRDLARRDWAATGIPITPIDDNGLESPYPLALISVDFGGQTVARTQAVVPVSWEMSCNICHNTPGVSVATDILRAHDRLHSTQLEQHQPVFCASCHADNALGTSGQAGVPNLSLAMHGAHASRMAAANLAVSCYACHPGFRTECLRDVHFQRGMTCISCHGDMATVANPARRPWLDQPSCASCHTTRRPDLTYEPSGSLFRNSVGHMGVQCMTCHGSPHAITPTVTPVDNLQAVRLQGHAGKINSCTVCHTQTPSDPFPHRPDDD